MADKLCWLGEGGGVRVWAMNWQTDPTPDARPMLGEPLGKAEPVSVGALAAMVKGTLEQGFGRLIASLTKQNYSSIHMSGILVGRCIRHYLIPANQL